METRRRADEMEQQRGRRGNEGGNKVKLKRAQDERAKRMWTD